MNRMLVEGATHYDRINSLIEEKDEKWYRYQSKIGGKQAAQEMLAKLIILDRTIDVTECGFPNDDERIMTRLGEDGLVLSLDTPIIGPFGRDLEQITLPARWSIGIPKDVCVKPRNVGSDVILTIADRDFLYSREGLSCLTQKMTE